MKESLPKMRRIMFYQQVFDFSALAGYPVFQKKKIKTLIVEIRVKRCNGLK